MNRNQNIRLRLLTYGVIAYLLIAFAWWSVLLYTKNQDAFQAKVRLHILIMIAEGNIKTDSEFYQTQRYQELRKEYQRQEWMILGEAAVFVISLVIGVWLINRGYNNAVLAAQQRRNFLLSITHELKSPIASIRLVLETMLKRKLTESQADKLGKNALQETERLNTLVNDLLLSAKLESAYQPYKESLNLVDLLQDLVQRMKNKYPKGKFNFHSATSSASISGDRLGMTSVALNLLENAVKYSIEAPEIDVRLEEENHQIKMDFADQGIGISNKEKKKIFEKFYRVGNEDTRNTKGTGLGLYIVNQIVKAHQGSIDVLDNQPKGTIFRIVLPKF